MRPAASFESRVESRTESDGSSVARAGASGVAQGGIAHVRCGLPLRRRGCPCAALPPIREPFVETMCLCWGQVMPGRHFFNYTAEKIETGLCGPLPKETLRLLTSKMPFQSTSVIVAPGRPGDAIERAKSGCLPEGYIAPDGSTRLQHYPELYPSADKYGSDPNQPGVIYGSEYNVTIVRASLVAAPPFPPCLLFLLVVAASLFDQAAAKLHRVGAPRAEPSADSLDACALHRRARRPPSADPRAAPRCRTMSFTETRITRAAGRCTPMSSLPTQTWARATSSGSTGARAARAVRSSLALARDRARGRAGGWGRGSGRALGASVCW